MARFIFLVLLIAIVLASVNYARYSLLECELEWDGCNGLPIIKFDDFEKYYRLNPSCWVLEKLFVERVYYEEGIRLGLKHTYTNKLRFRFHIKDYKKYRSFLKRLEKESKEARDAEDHVKLINLVTQDIKAVRQKAKDDINQAQDIIKSTTIGGVIVEGEYTQESDL